MKAETVTLTITIRPSYADAEYFKTEVEQSLEWLVYDHSAATIAWGANGQGEWPDEEDEDES